MKTLQGARETRTHEGLHWSRQQSPPFTPQRQDLVLRLLASPRVPPRSCVAPFFCLATSSRSRCPTHSSFKWTNMKKSYVKTFSMATDKWIHPPRALGGNENRKWIERGQENRREVYSSIIVYKRGLYTRRGC